MDKQDLPTKCCIGERFGNGLHIGFPGWGAPDRVLNPAVPLDAQIEGTELNGAFQAVTCRDLLHRLHGDCTLTHGVRGVFLLAAPGGRVVFEYTSLHGAAGRAIEMLGRRQWVGAQAIEKYAFGEAVDNGGVLYPQTMLSLEKMELIIAASGGEVISAADAPMDEVPLLADEYRLPGVADEVWAASSENFKVTDRLRFVRPNCVLCERVTTKRDHDRQYFSRYCKDHYQEAREKHHEMVRVSLTIRVEARKRDGS